MVRFKVLKHAAGRLYVYLQNVDGIGAYVLFCILFPSLSIVPCRRGLVNDLISRRKRAEKVNRCFGPSADK